MPVKRHHDYAALTVLLCRPCMQQHVKQFVIRYPVQAFGEEQCQCRCGCTNAGEAPAPQLGVGKRKHTRKPGARTRTARTDELFTA